MGRLRTGLLAVSAAAVICFAVRAEVPPANPLIPSRFLATLRLPMQDAPVPQRPAAKGPVVDPKGDLPLPEGEGKDTAKRVCGNCHSTNVWVRQRHTREKWSSIIDNMLSKGLEASEDDLALVNDYLAVNLAPVSKDSNPPPASPSGR